MALIDHTGQPLTLMAIHAHPDDEVLGTGGVFPRYAAEGVQTVLVTATLGHEGEIHDPDLDHDEARPRLDQIRENELRRAVAILGIAHLELLGYRDSGMVDTPANADPSNFHNANHDEAVGRLVQLIRHYRPQVLITYNEDGSYGHPDHIQCYRVTLAAYEAAGDPTRYPEAGPAWYPSKLYATAWSRELWVELQAEMKERGIQFDEDQHDQPDTAAQEVTGEAEPEPNEQEPWGQPNATITAFIDTSAYWATAQEALRQHRTQPLDFFLKLPDDLFARIYSHDYFVLLRSRISVKAPEDDLFAGVRAEA